MTRPSVESMINQTQGPFLEVGGPTQYIINGPSIDFDKIEKPLIVSNVAPDYVREGYWGNRLLGGFYATEPPTGLRKALYRFRGEEPMQRDFRLIEHDLDVRADATELPIANGVLGALYASALPPQTERSFVTIEAPRTLEPGGILVVEKMKKNTKESIPPYFDVIRAKKAGKSTLNVVLKRNDMPYEQPQEK